MSDLIPTQVKHIIVDYINFNKPINEIKKEFLSLPRDLQYIENMGFNCLTREILIDVLNRALVGEIDHNDLSSWAFNFLAGIYLEYEAEYFNTINDVIHTLELSDSFNYEITDELIKEQIEKLKNAQPET